MEKRHFAWEHKDKAPEQWMKVMWSKKRGQQSDAPIMPSARCVSLGMCRGLESLCRTRQAIDGTACSKTRARAVVRLRV